MLGPGFEPGFEAAFEAVECSGGWSEGAGLAGAAAAVGGPAAATPVFRAARGVCVSDHYGGAVASANLLTPSLTRI